MKRKTADKYLLKTLDHLRKTNDEAIRYEYATVAESLITQRKDITKKEVKEHFEDIVTREADSYHKDVRLPITADVHSFAPPKPEELDTRTKETLRAVAEGLDKRTNT